MFKFLCYPADHYICNDFELHRRYSPAVNSIISSIKQNIKSDSKELSLLDKSKYAAQQKAH